MSTNDSSDSKPHNDDRQSEKNTEKRGDDDCFSDKDDSLSYLQLRAQLRESRRLQKEAECREKEMQSEIESLRHALKNAWCHIRCVKSAKRSPSGPTRAAKNALRAKCKDLCQITGQKKNLTVSHIWTKEFAAELESDYGGRFSVNGQENLLHLAKPLEIKFDAGQLCFLPRASENSVDGVLELKILSQTICNEAVIGTAKTFKDLEGALLDMRVHMPSYTLISKHAIEAIMFAHTQGWITSEEKESLLTRAKFFSPESGKAREIQEWLKSRLDPGASQALPQHLDRTSPVSLQTAIPSSRDASLFELASLDHIDAAAAVDISPRALDFDREMQTGEGISFSVTGIERRRGREICRLRRPASPILTLTLPLKFSVSILVCLSAGRFVSKSVCPSVRPCVSASVRLFVA